MLRNACTKIALISLTLTLAACGSSVKLSDVPVEDRAGSSAESGSANPGAGASSAPVAPPSSGPRSVAPLQLAPAGSAAATPGTASSAAAAAAAAAAGPAGFGRVVYFDYDSFAIKPEFQAAIEGHARFLNANKNRSIRIEGHTDDRGGREYNLALGQKRSEAVRRALGLLGVSDAQIEPVSLGKEKPAAMGESEEAFQKNRRAEIVYR